MENIIQLNHTKQAQEDIFSRQSRKASLSSLFRNNSKPNFDLRQKHLGFTLHSYHSMNTNIIKF